MLVLPRTYASGPFGLNDFKLLPNVSQMPSVLVGVRGIWQMICLSALSQRAGTASRRYVRVLCMKLTCICLHVLVHTDMYIFIYIHIDLHLLEMSLCYLDF